jgi:hypothetical protein
VAVVLEINVVQLLHSFAMEDALLQIQTGLSLGKVEAPSVDDA